MTSRELRLLLKAWIIKVLITEGGETTLKIISSNPNAPIPSDAHITIEYNASRERFGRASKGDVQSDGTRLLVSDWQGPVTLWETFGDGDRLRQLVDSLDREDIIQEFFQGTGVAHLGSGEITPTPRVSNESWVKESSVELQLAIAEGTRETTSWIETVEYEGDIKGVKT